MKRVIFWVFIAINTVLSAKTYYVAPHGNNNNPGTISMPWETWQYAFDNTPSGDTCYFRDGIYHSTVTITCNNKSGSRTNPICFFAYPGEKPVIDFSTKPNPRTHNYGVRITYSTNLHFKGLTGRNVYQFDNASYCVGIWDVTNCNNIKFEQCIGYNAGGGAFQVSGTDTIYFTNCDAYNCSDPYTTYDPGGGGFGFNWSQDSHNGYIIFKGCRAWNCSDVGFGGTNEGFISLDSCWSMQNGFYLTNADGVNGSGFKLGLNITNPKSGLSLVVRNCIAAYNKSIGFTPNDNKDHNRQMHIYNNFIYHNGIDHGTYSTVKYGFFFTGKSDSTGTFNNWIRNNISYNNYNKNNVGDYYTNSPYINCENNYWLNNPTVTEEDFVSLDTTGMMGPRPPDGSLPFTTFGHLSEGSNLIDAGTVNTGLPYNGKAPDVGWVESQSVVSTPIIPIYVNSNIKAATPSLLEMTFNLSMANIIPSATAFTVKVNNVTRSVSAVAISGTRVLLTLASPVVYGDVVNVAYAKPASNPLQTASGGQAASMTAQSVTNSVTAVIPVYVSSAIQDASPARLEMTYNLSLASVVPSATAFTVKVNNVTRSVSAVAISGTRVLLTLASPVVYGDVVNVAYAKPASNPLQTASGGQAASMTAQNVTNNAIAVNNQPPVVSISSPTKSNAFFAPATITIDANASDPDGSVAKVEFYNGSSLLGEINSAPYSYTWKEVPAGTFFITAAATDNKGLRTVSAPVTVVVEKSTTGVNQLPSVSVKISNSKKPKKHDNVVIIAEASDPDGTISKVELKSGDVTIVEMTATPFVYTLLNVDTGTYVITAIATDNLGASITSDAFKLRVEDSNNPDPNLISLYPNPNNGIFSIDILSEIPDQLCTLSIVDLRGSIVYQDKVTPEETTKEIGLPDLQPGTYVLMLINKNTIMTTKKFIKQ